MPRNSLDILAVSAVDGWDAILDCMVEVKLKANGPSYDPFLRIMETLTRVGVHRGAKRDSELALKEKKLYQTCHILHKNEKYYIVHFKHLFMLDGHYNGFVREDVMRMNRIIKYLEEWGMIEVVNPEQITDLAHPSYIKVVKYDEAANWQLIHKYDMNKRSDNGNR